MQRRFYHKYLSLSKKFSNATFNKLYQLNPEFNMTIPIKKDNVKDILLYNSLYLTCPKIQDLNTQRTRFNNMANWYSFMAKLNLDTYEIYNNINHDSALYRWGNIDKFHEYIDPLNDSDYGTIIYNYINETKLLRPTIVEDSINQKLQNYLDNTDFGKSLKKIFEKKNNQIKFDQISHNINQMFLLQSNIDIF